MKEIKVIVQELKTNGHKGLGSVIRVSPIEMLHALVFAMERDILAGSALEILKGWRKTWLSCPFVFLKSDTNPRQAMLQERESAVAQFNALRHSAFQRMLDVYEFRKSYCQGRATNDSDVAKAYRGDVIFASTSEVVSENYVRQDASNVMKP